MSHLDHEKPADWVDPGPRVLVRPWCEIGLSAGAPFSGIAHGRCPGRPCSCPCHGDDEGDQ